MARRKIAIFSDHNARIEHVSEEEADLLRGHPRVVFDPDISQVSALPPHHWKKGEGSLILPMAEEEKKERDALHEDQTHENLTKDHLISGKLPPRPKKTAAPHEITPEAIQVFLDQKKASLEEKPGSIEESLFSQNPVHVFENPPQDLSHIEERIDQCYREVKIYKNWVFSREEQLKKDQSLARVLFCLLSLGELVLFFLHLR